MEGEKFSRSESSPQERVEEVPFASELGLEPAAIEWIKEVKKQSDLDMSVEPKKRIMGALMSGYDLIELHLHVLKDIGRHGSSEHLLSHSTEKKLDNIVNYILEREQRYYRHESKTLNTQFLEEKYKELEIDANRRGNYDSLGSTNLAAMIKALSRLIEAKSDNEKMTALTLYLNTWHTIANRGMRMHFLGIPEREQDIYQHIRRETTYLEFLDNLNNLDNKAYWENKKKDKS